MAQPARASSRREINLSNNSGLCVTKEAGVRATSLVAGAGLGPLTMVSVACSRARRGPPREGPGVGAGQARQTAPRAIVPPHAAAGCVLSEYTTLRTRVKELQLPAL